MEVGSVARRSGLNERFCVLQNSPAIAGLERLSLSFGGVTNLLPLATVRRWIGRFWELIVRLGADKTVSFH